MHRLSSVRDNTHRGTKGGDDPKVPEGRQVDDLLAAE